MKIKKVLLALFIFIVVGAALLGITDRAARAAGDAGSTDTAMANKLEQVLNNQKLILTELAAIREELGIVKVRVTQAQ